VFRRFSFESKQTWYVSSAHSALSIPDHASAFSFSLQQHCNNTASDPQTARHNLSTCLLVDYNMAYENSHAQASTNYKEAFQLFDKRGNGRVALDSLGDLLRACGQNPTLAEIKELEKNVGGDCRCTFLLGNRL
jgi:hypothetical protein